MKKIILSAAAAVGMLGTSLAAHAADLPARMPTKAPILAPIEVVNWTGFYVGGNVGYSWGRASTDFTSPTNVTTNNRQDLNGVLGGGQIGYNWQSSMWVFGLEADLQWTGQRGRQTAIDTNPADLAAVGGCAGLQVCTLAIVATLDQKLEWFGTARGRIGYLVSPRWMVYGTGGFAYGKVQTNLRSVEPDTETDVSNASQNRIGWAAGAGVEAMFWDGWSWKLEYLHLDLGGGSTNATILHSGIFTPPSGIVSNFGINPRVTDEIVRIGLNYHFRP